jgi:hypothetical protein
VTDADPGRSLWLGGRCHGAVYAHEK